MIDAQEIRAAIATLYAPTDVFEVRVLEGADRVNGRTLQWAGWFTGADAEAVAAQLARLRGGWHGVYSTLNPCDPLLLHRSARALKPAARGTLTTDAGILRRRWLPLDFDPVVWGDAGRIFGIGATEGEKVHAIDRAVAVARALGDAGFPDPVRTDSGNGGWLLWRVDLPADSTLPERFVRAVARRWGDAPGVEGAWDRSATVEIDTSIFNPARITKLSGTLACKGAGIDDRPWRMGRLLDVPYSGPDVLDAALLAAWIDAQDAAAAAEAPEAAPTPPRGATATPGPSGGDFDALAIARAAGMDLTDGRKRADGATFHEVRSACPGCGNARKAWISIATSGAVGFGCREGTCTFADTNGHPGDHWKRWRTGADPDYRPDGPTGPTTAERTDRAAAFGDRHAPASGAGGVDVAAIVGDTPAPEAAPARPARRIRDVTDTRHRIIVTDDARTVRDNAIAALATSPAVYLSQGKLAIADRGTMARLSAGGLDSAIVDSCRCVKLSRDRSSGEWVEVPDALPVRVRGMLEAVEALAPETAALFRVVEQVTRTPFFTPSGVSVTAAGYNAEARTLLVDPPTLVDTPEPDGAACLAYIREMLCDFPFEGGPNGAEVSNLIGAMLVPMVRPMISGPVPMLLIEGNVPGLGKSYLASAIRILYGLDPEAGSLPKDEKLIASLMLGILMKSEPVHVFDDVGHSVISSTLNRTITGRTYSDRILGVSDTASYVIRQLWIMTMNNARVSADLVRRVFRCRLLWPGPGRPEDRRGFRIPDFLGHVTDRRADLLARLRQLVTEWIDAGRPVPDDLPAMGSFESFARVVGGILRHAGDRAWLTNAAATKEAVALDDDWGPFLAAWHADPAIGGAWGTPVRPGALWRFADTNGHLTGILGAGGNEAAQISRVASVLRGHRDQVAGGYRLVEARDTAGMRVYRVERVVETSMSMH
jgi:hypothetical protein